MNPDDILYEPIGSSDHPIKEFLRRLHDLTDPNSKNYDPDFYRKVRENARDWFGENEPVHTPEATISIYP